MMSYLFFLSYPAPTEIYTLSLHDALPICAAPHARRHRPGGGGAGGGLAGDLGADPDRHREVRRSEEHTLNSSHRCISYAVFCLKKKTKQLKATKTTTTIRGALERNRPINS